MYEQRLFASKTYPNFVTMDQFLGHLFFKQILTESEKLKLSHNSIIKYGTTMKTESFQKQQQQQKMKIRTPVKKLRMNIHYIYMQTVCSISVRFGIKLIIVENSYLNSFLSTMQHKGEKNSDFDTSL